MFRILALLIFISSCGKYLPHEYGSGFGGNTSTIVSISGHVFKDTSSSVNSLSLLTQNSPIQLPLNGEACNGNFTLYYLGSGGFPIYQSSTQSDGSFEIPEVHIGVEGVVEFDCNNTGQIEQRCLVKAGDEGITCNLISDAIIDSLENSLSINMKTDQQLIGRTLARVAQSIVEAANSNSDDAEQFRTEFSDCESDRSCRQNVIETNEISSSTFEIVKTLARSWQVDRLLSFATEILGYQINVDWILYSSLGDLINFSLGTDFVSEAKKLICELHADCRENALIIKYPRLTIQCELKYQYYEAPGQFPTASVRYPSVQTDQNSLPSCITEDQIKAALNLETLHPNLLAHLENYDPDSYFCMNASSGGTGFVNIDHPLCLFPPSSPVIISTNAEKDRNDVDQLGEEKTYQPPIFMIDIFEELNAGLIDIQNDPTKPNNCYELDTSGNDLPPPYVNGSSQSCRNWLAPRFNELKPYFAGLLGLYIYLAEAENNNRNIRRFSLEEIYQVMAGSNFLNTKMVGRGDMRYYHPFNDHFAIPPVLKRQGMQTLQYQNIFTQAVSLPDMMAALNHPDATLPYGLTLYPLRHLPTTTSHSELINNARTHRGWNPSGIQEYTVAYKAGSHHPIFCKIDNPELICDTDSIGLLDNRPGLFDFPPGYDYNLVLRYHSNYESSTGPHVFELFDHKTSKYIQDANGQRLYAIDANAEASCDGTDSVTININDSNVQAYCFDPDDYAAQINGTAHSIWSGSQPHQAFRLTVNDVFAGEELCLYVSNIEINDSRFVLHEASQTITRFNDISQTAGTIIPASTITIPPAYTVNPCSEPLANHQSFQLMVHPDTINNSDSKENFYVYIKDSVYNYTQNPIQIYTDSHILYPDTGNNKIFTTLAGVNVYDYGVIKNPNHNLSLAPYCDAYQANDCDPSEVPNQLTFSEPLRFYDYNKLVKMHELFDSFGGADGDNQDMLDFIIQNDLQHHISPYITCRYTAAGESFPRKPLDIEFIYSNGDGCPQAEGESISDGPLRLANLKPRINSYLISKPRGLIRSFNYATKSVGQGVRIDTRQRVFTFDEALALISYRLQMPLTNLTVLHAPLISDSQVDYPRVELQNIPSEDNQMIDNPIQALLKGIIFPQELESVSIHP